MSGLLWEGASTASLPVTGRTATSAAASNWFTSPSDRQLKPYTMLAPHLRTNACRRDLLPRVVPLGRVCGVRPHSNRSCGSGWGT